MEYTFGNSKACKYLEDLVEKNKSDKKSVSRLLSSTFRVLNNIQDNVEFRYLSGLIVKDFKNKVDNSKHEYSHPDIKDLMKNVVIRRKRLIMQEKFPEDSRRTNK